MIPLLHFCFSFAFSTLSERLLNTVNMDVWAHDCDINFSGLVSNVFCGLKKQDNSSCCVHDMMTLLKSN